MKKFAIFIAIASILTQAYHSYYTFSKISNLEGTAGIINAIAFVVSFESFVLYYTLKGREKLALFYAISIAIMNIFYYWNRLEPTSVDFYVALFISIIMPVSIHSISKEIRVDNFGAIPKKEKKRVKKENIEQLKMDL